MAFGKVTDFGRPVVHLGVDIHGPFAFPRRSEFFIPDPLQVGRLGAWARAGDEEITAELEVEDTEGWIVSISRLPNPDIGRIRRRRCRP